MAVKATKTDAALTVMDLGGDTGFNPLAGMVEPERGSFLPQFKLPYISGSDVVIPVLGDDGKPMVRAGQPVTETGAGRLVLQAGKGKVEHIKPPYILTAYCIRGATRGLTADKKYTYTFAAFNNGKNNPKHEQAMIDSDDPAKNVSKGNVGLIIALTNDGRAAVGLMDMFRSQTKYWGELFKNGMLFNGKQGVRITVDDHRVNLVTSQNGYQYYGYQKFNQWSQVTLDDSQFALVKEALKANQKSCDEWLNRSE